MPITYLIDPSTTTTASDSLIVSNYTITGSGATSSTDPLITFRAVGNPDGINLYFGGWDSSYDGVSTGSDTIININDDTDWYWQENFPVQYQEVQQWGIPHIKKRSKAEERAHGLLMEHLTIRQQQDYEKHGYFHVTTPKKHKYRICKGRMGNVYRLNKRGKVIRSFCIHPRKWVPDEDTMLTQLLLLLTDEDRFLKVANHRKARWRAQLIPMAA